MFSDKKFSFSAVTQRKVSLIMFALCVPVTPGWTKTQVSSAGRRCSQPMHFSLQRPAPLLNQASLWKVPRTHIALGGETETERKHLCFLTFKKTMSSLDQHKNLQFIPHPRFCCIQKRFSSSYPHLPRIFYWILFSEFFVIKIHFPNVKLL